MTLELGSTRYSWLAPVLWAALAFPLAVISHEFAHYAAYLVFGFPKPQLHYDSTSYQDNSEFWKLVKTGDMEQASTIVVPQQAGIASGAGILASWLVMLFCLLLAFRKPHFFVIALGYIATFRFLGSVFILAANRLGRNGSDEEHVSLVLPISELLLHVLGIVSMLVTWFLLFRVISPKSRLKSIGLLTLGALLGGILYIVVIGPLVLP